MGRIAKIDPSNPEPELILQAARILQSGLLVAFPTETVYGLGANGLDESAVRRIYEAKGRPSRNPLILHVNSHALARELVLEWPEKAELLTSLLWPGPLTIVLRKSPKVPAIATAQGDTVALRMPAHRVALALIEAAGFPLAAPSANRSSEISPTRAEHVAKSLGERVDLILDGGPTRRGIESTVVDLSRKPYGVLRFGPLHPSRLQEILGTELLGPRVADTGNSPLPSPGMIEKHYAPKTPLILCQSEEDWVRLGRQQRETVLLRLGWHAISSQRIVQMPLDAKIYEAKLYATLHECDNGQYEAIIVEMPPNEEEWFAVRDRLTRAAVK